MSFLRLLVRRTGTCITLYCRCIIFSSNRYPSIYVHASETPETSAFQPYYTSLQFPQTATLKIQSLKNIHNYRTQATKVLPLQKFIYFITQRIRFDKTILQLLLALKLLHWEKEKVCCINFLPKLTSSTWYSLNTYPVIGSQIHLKYTNNSKFSA